MSALYGSLQSDRTKQRTCRSFHNIKASARSWNYSVCAEIDRHEEEETYSIRIGRGSDPAPMDYELELSANDIEKLCQGKARLVVAAA